jgi:hypothetical protein
MIETFQMIEIDSAETLQELCEKEIAHIEIHNSHYKRGYGYNMTDGGEGVIGYSHTDETKEKLRIGTLKQFESTEARQKQSDRSRIYYAQNPNAGKAHGKKMKVIMNKPEKKKELRVRQNERFKNPAERLKTSEAGKKYYRDNPDARRKTSEAGKKYYENNPDARRKLSDGKGKNKQFDIFKKDGTYIKSFNYQFEAREYLQKTYFTDIKTHIDISAVLRGKKNSSHGFVFKYKQIILNVNK